MAKDLKTEHNISYREEYRLVKKDLLSVMLVNGILFAALLALYYANRNTRFLEEWFSKF